jgi:hypothetical protein
MVTYLQQLVSDSKPTMIDYFVQQYVHKTNYRENYVSGPYKYCYFVKLVLNVLKVSI